MIVNILKVYFINRLFDSHKNMKCIFINGNFAAFARFWSVRNWTNPLLRLQTPVLVGSLMDVRENVVWAKRPSPLSPPVSSLQFSVRPASPPLFTSGFFWAPGCAAVGQLGQDSEQTELKKWQSREAHRVKGETFIIAIVSSWLAPASMTAQMSCLFNTPEMASSPAPLIP